MRMFLNVLVWLVPAAALAHVPGEHPADPNLHVDPSLKDCSVQFAPTLTQEAFRRFAREFGSLGAFKQSAPSTTLGRWGVWAGVEMFYFSVEERSAAWNDTFAHPDAYHELGSNLNFPKLRARLGITEKLDVGAYYTLNPSSNYGWLGLEARYGLLEQKEAMPVSLAVRGAYTKTLYVQDMDMHAVTADLTAGRTFFEALTPYLGVGGDLVLVRETADAVDLRGEAQLVPHLVGGFSLRLWHVSVGAELQLAEVTNYQVQLAAVF